VAVGDSVGVSVVVGVDVVVGGAGVLVTVGVAVGAQLDGIDCVVPSRLVIVAVRLDSAGALTEMLLCPVSENASPTGPPGVTVYVPIMVVPGLSDDDNVKTALPFASVAHVTLRVGAGCVCGSAG
jgi:hypothetical protein